MKRKKIYFRADAGPEEGYGHFVRTLALADMLKDEFDCTFFTAEPTEYMLGEVAKVCECKALYGDDVLSDFLTVLKGDEIVVLDNYFYTPDYQKKIKDIGCKLVAIDDMHDMHHFADVIVNISPLDNIQYDAEPYTQILTGRDWLLLRSDFLNTPSRNLQRNNDIIICFGGSDPYRITNRFIDYIKPEKYDGKVHVIAGDQVYINPIYKDVILSHRNLSASQMIELFDKSMVAIVACSMVHVEAMTRGIPLLAGYYVDNQEEDYRYGLDNGNFIGLGDLLQYDGSDLSEKLELAKNFEYKIDVNKVKDNFIKLFKTIAQ